jgi:hypothetical protein
VFNLAFLDYLVLTGCASISSISSSSCVPHTYKRTPHELNKQDEIMIAPLSDDRYYDTMTDHDTVEENKLSRMKEL